MIKSETREKKQLSIATEVFNERDRQDDKWGNQEHNLVEWMAILTEEVGEASKEAVDYHFEYPPGTYAESDLANARGNLLQYNRLKNYRKELIQVMAVAMQMVEDLDERYLSDE